MFKFLRARHRSVYVRLGWKYSLWPDTVRKLAHGKRPRTSNQKHCLHALLNEGIVHRRHDSDSFSTSEDKVVFGS